MTKTSNNIKHNVEKCRALQFEKIRKDNFLLGVRLQTKQPYINARKYEEEYVKNKSIRTKAKNFNLPTLRKLGFKLISNSTIHKKLMQTINSSSNPATVFQYHGAITENGKFY